MKIFLFLCIVVLFSCEKETGLTSPDTFCWRCEKETTTYYNNCGTRTMHMSENIETVCDMTEKDALDYEATWGGVSVIITGSMSNKPCDYVRTDTYHVSMKCYKQGN
jgi:hypothetical protein